MKKDIFYSKVETIVWTFPFCEVMGFVLKANGISSGTIRGEVVDDEGTVEIIQEFRNKDEKIEKP